MRLAVLAAKDGCKAADSLGHDPFGAVVVCDGVGIAKGCNTMRRSRDCTATAVVNAIVAASAELGTYNLEQCEIYATALPDVMSLGAVLWARIPRIYAGVTQEFAAQHGFEEGTR